MLRNAAFTSLSLARSSTGTQRATARRPATDRSVLPTTMTIPCNTVLWVSAASDVTALVRRAGPRARPGRRRPVIQPAGPEPVDRGPQIPTRLPRRSYEPGPEAGAV